MYPASIFFLSMGITGRNCFMWYSLSLWGNTFNYINITHVLQVLTLKQSRQIHFENLNRLSNRGWRNTKLFPSLCSGGGWKQWDYLNKKPLGLSSRGQNSDMICLFLRILGTLIHHHCWLMYGLGVCWYKTANPVRCLQTNLLIQTEWESVWVYVLHSMAYKQGWSLHGQSCFIIINTEAELKNMNSY